MTRTEADKLDVFMAEFREFRQDDRAWKQDIGARVRSVELFVASETTEEQVVTAAGISRRALVTQVIAGIGIVVSGVLGVWNLLT